MKKNEELETDFIDSCRPVYLDQPEESENFNIIWIIILGLFFMLLIMVSTYQSTKTKALRQDLEALRSEVKTIQTHADPVQATTLVPTIVVLPTHSVPTLMETRVFKVTAYCACHECCGKTDGITATGVKVQEGVTCAADWSVLAPGSVIDIDGIGVRIVQDKGSAVKGDHIDLYVPDHKTASAWGVKYLRVTILKEGR